MNERDPTAAPDFDEVKLAIVAMLQARPKNSCKKNQVARLTASHLHFRRAGQKGKHFNRDVGHALSHLKHAGIVEFYRATNERIRLSKDYEKKFEKLTVRINRKRTREQYQVQSRQSRLPSFDTAESSPPDWGLGGITLPDLPDDEVGDEDETNDRVESSPVVDDVRATGGPGDGWPERRDLRPDDVPAHATIASQLAELEVRLAALYSIHTQRRLHSVWCDITTERGDHIEVVVEIRPHTREVWVKAATPFRPDAAIEVLRLAEAESFRGAASVCQGDGGSTYVIRRRERWQDDLLSSMERLVVDTVSEIAKAQEVIARY